MALVENPGPDSVHFLKAGQLDVLNESIKKEIEVFIASLTSIDKVVGGQTVIVIDLRPHGEKDLIIFWKSELVFWKWWEE